ncbi:hypothetical protein IMG5_004160 [Ichthyophthirius multifiliis]|uniref:Uncharacterized protein n=1 Tax=Ichthyophthirius multifiliis TaxID=5932 RepID=G0QJC8_ICHMU|nr:hypothetical protein IMG5_004160 [Ichthyophthirius multifiliis]EGR34668.1 hypothetical protein IMG5_004160 [Ichthyophthirius multifiliis]|eukprot:XP_004039972.1 hypothetical protein IMG5_004160 [Ichthyophthirius multifiliis]
MLQINKKLLFNFIIFPFFFYFFFKKFIHYNIYLRILSIYQKNKKKSIYKFFNKIINISMFQMFICIKNYFLQFAKFILNKKLRSSIINIKNRINKPIINNRIYLLYLILIFFLFISRIYKNIINNAQNITYGFNNSLKVYIFWQTHSFSQNIKILFYIFRSSFFLYNTVQFCSYQIATQFGQS